MGHVVFAHILFLVRWDVILFFSSPNLESAVSPKDHWALTMEDDPDSPRSGPSVCSAEWEVSQLALLRGQSEKLHLSFFSLDFHLRWATSAGGWYLMKPASSVDCGKSQGAGPSGMAEAHLPAASSWAPAQWGQANLEWVWMGSLGGLSRYLKRPESNCWNSKQRISLILGLFLMKS